VKTCGFRVEPYALELTRPMPGAAGETRRRGLLLHVVLLHVVPHESLALQLVRH
jgi:hypothetical protein